MLSGWWMCAAYSFLCVCRPHRQLLLSEISIDPRFPILAHLLCLCTLHDAHVTRVLRYMFFLLLSFLHALCACVSAGMRSCWLL